MADWTKVAETTILTRTAVTHPDTVEGTATAVAADDSVLITCYWASIEAAANTNAGSFLIQCSGSASGDDDWATVAEIGTPTGTAGSEVISNDSESGPVIEVASTTGFAAGEWLYARDLGSEAGSCWRYIDKIVSNTSVNVLDALTTALNNADSDILWSDAQVTPIVLDVSTWQRVRIVYSHEGAAGCNCVVEATMAKASDFE